MIYPLDPTHQASRFDEEDVWIQCVNNVTAQVFDGQYAVVDGYALTTMANHPKAIDGHHYGDCHVPTKGQGWPGQGIRDAVINLAFGAVCKHNRASLSGQQTIPDMPRFGKAKQQCKKRGQ
jgi:hypothetical protein